MIHEDTETVQKAPNSLLVMTNSEFGASFSFSTNSDKFLLFEENLDMLAVLIILNIDDTPDHPGLDRSKQG